MLSKLKYIFLAIMPSQLKIAILNRSGHQIHKSSYIGFCYLDIKNIILEENVVINSGNLFKGLTRLHMSSNSRIGGRLNWFTASKLHKNSDNKNFGEISIGAESNITSRHFFDAQHAITIGSNTLIAGFRSTFWTHGYREKVHDKNNSIVIGDHCYIGSQVIFSPGSSIGDCIIVGTGSVISKNYSNINNVLLAGNPAIEKKAISENTEFFSKSHKGFRPIKK